MSKNVILKAENISKQYRLGLVGTGTISHDLNRWWHKVRGKEDPYLKIGEVNKRDSFSESDYVWALQDINFEVEQGEVLGIIGKNGAGKSTLLKILSRVTSPTTGSIKTKGRIASLLEVGTGFHGEMTGRENIFLNGSILGMTKKEITSKIDEIIEFSGCQRYIDTPVKRYSSGMTVRLAFAVAAFLEPEILVVDEVLAVGDAEFQKKAIGKMQEISRGGGRTVIFVSHNLAAVSELCHTGIYLKNGSIYSTGSIQDVISDYLSNDTTFFTHISSFENYNFEKDIIQPTEFYIVGDNTNSTTYFFPNNISLKICVKFFIHKLETNFNFGIAVYDIHQQLIFLSLHTDTSPLIRSKIQLGFNDFHIALPSHLLNEGEYSIHLIASIHMKYWIIEPNVNSPYLTLKIKGGLSESDLWTTKRQGLLAPILEYEVVG